MIKQFNEFREFRETYSQIAQDLLALFCLGESPKYFVEFGACDGVYLSNTFMLEKYYGWNGLLVEPSHHYNKILKEIRSVNVDTLCVSDKTGEKIEETIKLVVTETLNKSKEVEMPDDLIETDNIGEVIEKLSILHCRMWYLEDAISAATSDKEIADLKRKIDICFKVKRPKYVQAVNRMIDNAIINDKSLVEDSVKHYQGFTESK